jgi:CHAD domain-containing protein
MANPLWEIPGLTALASTAEAARASFAARFAAVTQTWAAALDQPGDPHAVHQLRVATRRASAALRVFHEHLPSDSLRKFKKLFRKLRRMVGPARDEDVLAQRLQEWLAACDETERPGLDWLAGSFAKRRVRTHDAIPKTKKLQSKWESLIRSSTIPRNGGSSLLSDLASEQIPEQIIEFERAACGVIEAPDQLHALRIAGKRLRYSLELLSAGLPYAAKLADELPNAQDLLGAAHDARVIADRVAKRLKLLQRLPPDDQTRYLKGITIWKNALEMEAAAGPVRFRLWHRAWQAVVADLNLHFT